PVISDTPSAMAARIRARCEIDLSPGARTRPTSGPEGVASRRMGFWSGSGAGRGRRDGAGRAENAFDSGLSWWQGSRPKSRSQSEGCPLGQSRTRRQADLPELPGEVL